MELGKPRYEKMIWGPKDGPPRRNSDFFVVNFEDLLLNLFEEFLFSNFLSPILIYSLGFVVVGSVWKIGEYWAGPPSAMVVLLISNNDRETARYEIYTY